MATFYTTGSWQPFPGQEEQFLEEWKAFAGWATGLGGCIRPATLARDLRDESRFVSFLAWDSLEAIRAWKSHDEFKERMSRVQQHIDKFAPTELETVANA